MADKKKYLDLDGVGYLVTDIKAKRDARLTVFQSDGPNDVMNQEDGSYTAATGNALTSFFHTLDVGDGEMKGHTFPTAVGVSDAGYWWDTWYITYYADDGVNHVITRYNYIDGAIQSITNEENADPSSTMNYTISTLYAGKKGTINSTIPVLLQAEATKTNYDISSGSVPTYYRHTVTFLSDDRTAYEVRILSTDSTKVTTAALFRTMAGTSGWELCGIQYEQDSDYDHFSGAGVCQWDDSSIWFIGVVQYQNAMQLASGTYDASTWSMTDIVETYLK